MRGPLCCIAAPSPRTWDIAGAEFLGVYLTPAVGEMLLGSVTDTLDTRRQYGMPDDLTAVMYDGIGGILVLDTSHPDADGSTQSWCGIPASETVTTWKGSAQTSAPSP